MGRGGSEVDLKEIGGSPVPPLGPPELEAAREVEVGLEEMQLHSDWTPQSKVGSLI